MRLAELHEVAKLTTSMQQY